MRNQNRRPLPTLIALPIPKLAKLYGPPGAACFQHPLASKREEPKELDVHKAAILDAIDALRAVIELTLSFLKDGADYVMQPVEWILQLKSSLDDLEEALWGCCLEESVTIDTEGVDGLDSILDSVPDFDADFDETPDPFAKKMLLFWLDEIKRRGRELFDICIGSVDVCEAEHAFKTMKNLRYPVR
ncbi:MAG: hypothetical protein PHP85_13045 [Gallionella sp.]|nr:hypothetical protein [Gallionella sp.]